MSRSERTTRRTFIKSAVGTGLGWALAPQLACVAPGRRGPAAAPAGPQPETGAEGQPATPKFPDFRVAFIGTGGIGHFHLEHAEEYGLQCPCFCDVDTNRFGKAAELYPSARRYQDYRVMFDKEHKNFDAVMIGTPDHHHYPATIIAMQLGKHVYTQKPLTHTVWEARQLTQAARKYDKVVTQMGNQGHAREGWRLVYEWVHSGAIGRVKEVHTWTDRPVWPQGIDRPEGEDPVPANLDWDCWLGPAPVRPYKAAPPGGPAPYHPFTWRGWWDFGAGALGDMACHTMDSVFAVLDPGYPTAVEPIAATPVNKETFPTASALRWHFPAKGLRPAFVAYWYDGGLRPPFPPDLELGRDLPATGNLYIGTKGALLVAGDYSDSPRIIPESKMKEIGRPPRKLERSPGHVLEWILAAVGEKPRDFARANFAYAGPMTETILLGNIALRTGRRLEWDGRKMTFTNLPEADRYISKEYRAGWQF